MKKKIFILAGLFIVAVCIFIYVLQWREREKQALQKEAQIEATEHMLQERYSYKDEIAQALKIYEEKAAKREIIKEPLLLENRIS